jgi:hypothetical protein
MRVENLSPKREVDNIQVPPLIYNGSLFVTECFLAFREPGITGFTMLFEEKLNKHCEYRLQVAG